LRGFLSAAPRKACAAKWISIATDQVDHGLFAGGEFSSVTLEMVRGAMVAFEHATNICEEVYYSLEGEDLRHR
jgi:hypothetical protein